MAVENSIFLEIAEIWGIENVYPNRESRYCTYDFFDQCPHRMACAKCSFYVPKSSSQVQLVQGKVNLLQLRQEIPLSDSELAAVDDGVVAMEKLLEQLADVRTPAGPTPRELGAIAKAGRG